MTKYIALTIGPIIEALSESKKTKELFTASYLFSYVMKKIITSLDEKGYKFLSPFFDKDQFKEDDKHGVGLFHDRFIATSEKESKSDIETDLFESIRKAKESVIEFITDISKYEKDNKKVDESKIKDFIDNFIQISFIITKESNFTKLNRILDSLELQKKFITNPSEYKILKIGDIYVNPLEYLQYKFHNSSLKKDAFGNDENKKFRSTLEIALNKKINYTFDDKTDDELENEAIKNTKLHQRYLCIVQADGDNVGSLLKEIISTSNDNLTDFSKVLFEFAKDTPNISKKHGASVVYAGGDDVLAFTPVLINKENGECKTIFDYLKDLDNSFKSKMEKLKFDSAKKVSLSFGVSMVYHKKPLYEALDSARNNLFGISKNVDGKNAITLELIKHSGQTHKIILQLNDTELFESFNNLLKNELSTEAGLPHSIMYNLSRSKNLLITISHRKDMLEAFFENNFNEESHNQNSVRTSLNLARDLLYIYMNKNSDKDKNIKEFFDALSIIKHLRGDR